MKLKVYEAVVNSHVHFRKLPEERARAVVNAATFPNEAYLAAKRFSRWGGVSSRIPPTIQFAWRTEGTLLMHRGCLSMMTPGFRDRIMGRTRFIDNRVYSPAEFPPAKIELNREQILLMRRLEEELANDGRPFGNLLFLASTSVGKTILQSVAAARLGQRTLVLCVTELIRRAWEQDLKKLFGFRSKELGLIKRESMTVGRQFTLASVQTLGRRRDDWEKLNEMFGCVILDEAQNASAPKLFEFLAQSPAAYLMGATATAESRSGPNPHLIALLGHPVGQVQTYARETATSLPVSGVKVLRTTFEYPRIFGRDTLDWNDVCDRLQFDSLRNAAITRAAAAEWRNGRSLLVVTRRLAHVDMLCQSLSDAGVHNVNRLTGETNQDKYYSKQLFRAIEREEVTCVVATSQAIKVGANLPRLDLLFIAMPIQNRRDVEQLLGRIRRKAQGKTDARLVYVYDERFSYLRRTFSSILMPVLLKMKVVGDPDEVENLSV